MNLAVLCRAVRNGGMLATALVLATGVAAAQAPGTKDDAARVEETGKQFGCGDGSVMVLDFRVARHGIEALVVVHDQFYRLPARPSERNVAQVLWSDGANSLTWSPGVQLMWMSATEHLMCGGGHHH